MVSFTREPIVESVISPREGYKLAVRNSKGVGQEEYFVDALEVVSFGAAVFYRSLERPKNFLLPVSDYEVLEVRETRMVLKHVLEPEKKSKKDSDEDGGAPRERRRERRRSRRRTRREVSEEEASLEAEEEAASEEEVKKESPPEKKESPEVAFASMPPPPSGLISESIDRYKEMLAPSDKPELIPPTSDEDIPADIPIESPKGAGVFSPASFLRKLTGREEDEE